VRRTFPGAHLMAGDAEAQGGARLDQQKERGVLSDGPVGCSLCWTQVVRLRDAGERKPTFFSGSRQQAMEDDRGAWASCTRLRFFSGVVKPTNDEKGSVTRSCHGSETACRGSHRRRGPIFGLGLRSGIETAISTHVMECVVFLRALIHWTGRLGRERDRYLEGVGVGVHIVRCHHGRRALLGMHEDLASALAGL
jgi:hypothetical protein